MDFLGENSGDSVEFSTLQLLETVDASPLFDISDTSAILQLNGALPVDNNNAQRPYVEIVEQPQQRGFRFRYECEGPSHGGLQGENTERSRKTYPSIRIKNYEGPAKIEVSLVTDEKPPRIHAHKLVGKNCQDGVCKVDINSTASIISFPNLSILHVTRKKAVEVFLHHIMEDIKLKKQLSGVDLSSQPPISAEENLQAQKQAEEQARSMVLNVVRLKFSVVLLNNAEGPYPHTPLPPVVSKTIYDSKSPGASTLKICRMDKFGGCCTGNEEVFVLCEKVQKEDIAVRFLELGDDGTVKWEAFGSFSLLDVHRQYAIVFRTPAYMDTNIDRPVKVWIMLQRKSDGEVSEAKAFTFYPQNKDKDLIARKKRKTFPLDTNFGCHYSGAGGSEGGAMATASGLGDRFGSLGPTSLGKVPRVAAGGEPSCSNFGVILPSGHRVDHLNILPTSVEQAVKEEFCRSPESVTAEELYEEVPANFLDSIMNDDLEMDAAPSLRYSSQFVTPSGHAALPQKSRPDSDASSRLKENSKDDKLKSESSLDDQTKECATVQEKKDAVDSKSQKDDQQRKHSGSDKEKKCSEDEKQTAGFDDDKQARLERAENRDDPACHGEKDDESTRSGLTLPGGQVGETGRPDEDQPTVYDASKTESLQKKRELTQADQQKESQNGQRVAANKTSDTQTPKTHRDLFVAESDMGRKEHSETISPSTRMGNIATSEHVRTDEELPEISEILSVGEDYQLKKSQAAPELTDRRESEDAEDLAGKPVKAATTVVRRIIQKITAKTVLALRDYSETGDPSYLLQVQRHLTAVRNENGDLPLHLAVINSQTTVLRHLLAVMTSLPNAGEIINTCNYIRQTALHLAAIMQQPVPIELLLHAGADPSLTDRNGNTPAHLAILNDSLEGLHSLIKNLRPGVTTANPFPELDYLNYDGFSPVHLAARRGSVDMLRLLVHGHADVDLGDGKSGRTALHHAVEQDDLPVAGYLLMEANADVNARSFDGNTPLHVACCQGSIGMVALLMTAGALTDVENEEVPLEEAGEGGQEEEGSRFLYRGLQPRDYAAGKDRLRILRMLMGDMAGEDDYQSALDPDLGNNPDPVDDPDPTAHPDLADKCHCPVENDLKQDLGDLGSHKSACDSGVVDSYTSHTASEHAVKDKLTKEDHAALSKILDPQCAGKDVLELASRLGYDSLVPALEVMACSGSSPTLYLLDYNETYGSVSRLKECLQAMGCDDAVQILNKHL